MSQVDVVIGANGGIGREVVAQLAKRNPERKIYALARQHGSQDGPDNVEKIDLCTDDATAISTFCQQLRDADEQVVTAICTVGILHGEVDGYELQPEKKLEDLNSEQLHRYFQVNSIIPALWLKHLVELMSDKPSQLVCFSARVGSISDNRIGGWYGYRASKAALNMLMKTAAVEYGRRAKQTTLLCYHPGTVDTGLSEPFQRNVKAEKLFSPEFTVSQLMAALPILKPDQSPYFLDWDHEVVSW